MNPKEHWNSVYQSKKPDEVSWFQTYPAVSLKLIAACNAGKEDGIIDVGGGASLLVDCLLKAGYRNLAVLDISGAALDHAKQRLGEHAGDVTWLEADVTDFHPPRQFRVWHDRAVFHFLTDENDRHKYTQSLRRSLTADGQAIIATFAMDGPVRCSGLNVARYDAPTICRELGPDFELLEQVNETHATPWQSEQRFSYFYFRRKTPPPLPPAPPSPPTRKASAAPAASAALS